MFGQDVETSGVSAQRVTQAADHIAQDSKMVAAQEPFGYFKAEHFGWRDCAETDEGAIALYEAPQPQADARDEESEKLLRALYDRGYEDRAKERDYDPLGALLGAVAGALSRSGDAPELLKLVRQAIKTDGLELPKRFITVPQADARDAERWGSEPVTGTPFLQEEDQHLLDRFIETTEDNEGFDIGKEAIKRLANLGVVESLGFGRYGVTVFGYWVHAHHWHQNPSLPLKTNLDRDVDARAAIAKVTGAASSAAQPVKENT